MRANTYIKHALGKSRFYFNFFFIGVQLLYNVALLSAVQQSESAVCIHVSPPSWTPHSHPLSGSSRSPKLSTLCCMAGSHWLSSLHRAVHIHQFQSPSSSHPSSCPSIHLCSPHLGLYSHPADRFICTIFLDPTYIH